MAASASETRAPSAPGSPASPATAPTFFLPDFCASPAVFAIVLIAELVALVIALARQALHDNFWADLAGGSMFLLWVGLTCAGVLCRARPWLQTMAPVRAAMIAIALVVTNIGLVSEIVFRVGQIWGPDTQLWGGEAAADIGFFPRQHAGFVLRNIGVGFIVSTLALRYFYVSAEWKRSIEQEALARIRALQARIRPHFLFNSMNTIAALTRTSPERAEQAVEDLADLFRASLSDASARITLKDEIEIARTHQRIEQLRLGERLTVRWDVDELPMRTLVPSLLIQPLLENAVYHGIETLPRGGEISIVGRRDEHSVRIEVRNPILAQSGYSEREGNRVALDNIRQRLALAWPGRGRLETEQTEAEFCARLIFPYARDEASGG